MVIAGGSRDQDAYPGASARGGLVIVCPFVTIVKGRIQKMTKKKTAKFNPGDIGKLAKDKPVVYKLFDVKDENVYTGSSKKGQVESRIKDHLPGGCPSYTWREEGLYRTARFDF